MQGLKLGLEFVYYVKTTTDLVELDKQRDSDSVQAVRNGMGTGKLREGIVIRPLVELTKNNGERIICKYKCDTFSETKTTRKIIDPKKFGVHQKMPFLVEFSGMTAYRVDMLSQMRVIGNSREEVARRSAEFKILEYLSEYHEVVQFRSVRGK